MPDQHCPLCGTVRTAGSCGCSSDLTDTTVLPHIEGPPLVRPYVPQAVGRIGDHPDGPGPSRAAFPGLSYAPPAPGPGHPPAGPGHAYATALMPPVPSTGPPSAGAPAPAPGSGGPADELGLFAFDTSPGLDPAHAGPGGRAGRRAERRGPLARHRGAILAAGAGVLVLGVGVAFLAAPSDGGDRTALPAPALSSAPTASSPTAPPSATAPDPSAAAGGSAGASPTAARSSQAPTSRASAGATAAPATVTATTGSSAPQVPAKPTPATSATSTAPSPAASTPAPVRVLKRDMSGDDVRAMQTLLVAVSCGKTDASLESGTFDWWTQWVLTDYQHKHKLPKSEDGVYGPATRAALESDTSAC